MIMDMNTNPPDPAAAADDWLDAALVADAREHRDGYLADDGFTARVVAQLPPPAVSVPAWRRPAVAALWTAAAIGAAIALPGALQDVAREGFRVLGALPVSTSGIAAGVVALAMTSWAAAAYALRHD
jgi:hypothetical protein